MTKAEFRKIAIDKRNKISHKEEKDLLISKKLFSQKIYKDAKTIMVYISCRGEADTLKIIEKMLCDGKRLCAPVCVDKENMYASHFDSISSLKSGAYGILEPSGEVVSHIDLILVPGVAFNENLHRIGYGAGYYDRFLKENKAFSLGLFYEEQKMCFSSDEKDVPLDMIITDENVYERKILL